nr:hypothetical protein [Phytohabitans suffuscus]
MAPSLPERCQAQAGMCSESPGPQPIRSPSISVQPQPATTNTIASHECRWTVVATPGSNSCASASMVRVGRSPSVPTYTPTRCPRSLGPIATWPAETTSRWLSRQSSMNLARRLFCTW